MTPVVIDHDSVQTVCSMLAVLGLALITAMNFRTRSREKIAQEQEETRREQERTERAKIAAEVEKVRIAAERLEKTQKEATDAVAERVDEVRQETERTTTEVEKVRDTLKETQQALVDTHRTETEKIDHLTEVSAEGLRLGVQGVQVATEALRLGNGATGRLLRYIAHLEEWKASRFPEDEVAAAKAVQARKDYEEHVEEHEKKVMPPPTPSP